MKVEMKGGLWEVKIESGKYSDYRCDYMVVSGNSYEEAVNTVKVYYEDAMKHNELSHFKGLRFMDDDTIIETWIYKDIKNGYYEIEEVTISRLEVVYNNGILALPSLCDLTK